MESKDFIIVPKLLGLVVESQSGQVTGVVDASWLLSDESKEAITHELGEAIGRSQTEALREQLERQFRLPARDIERERAEGD